MKFGVRKPSLKKKIAARTSVKRMVRSKVRAPRGYGFITNPKRAAYNRVYNRTSFSAGKLLKAGSKGTPELKQKTGHGLLWWTFIGWWVAIIMVEFKLVMWLYKKLRKSQPTDA